MEDEIFIPVLHSFENGNTFSGSCGAMRFFLRPQLAAEGEGHHSGRAVAWTFLL